LCRQDRRWGRRWGRRCCCGGGCGGGRSAVDAVDAVDAIDAVKVVDTVEIVDTVVGAAVVAVVAVVVDVVAADVVDVEHLPALCRHLLRLHAHHPREQPLQVRQRVLEALCPRLLVVELDLDRHLPHLVLLHLVRQAERFVALLREIPHLFKAEQEGDHAVVEAAVPEEAAEADVGVAE
jgi:hypothetical protein